MSLHFTYIATILGVILYSTPVVNQPSPEQYNAVLLDNTDTFAFDRGSSFFAKGNAEQVIGRSIQAIKKKFPKSTCVQSSKPLLLCEIYARNIMGRRYVRINLAIIVFTQGQKTEVTIIASAHGEKRIWEPKSYRTPIMPFMILNWVANEIIPLIQ